MRSSRDDCSARRITGVEEIFRRQHLCAHFGAQTRIAGYGCNYGRWQARCAGAAACVLVLVGGDMASLQALTVSIGLPFGVGLFIGLREHQAMLKLAEENAVDG